MSIRTGDLLDKLARVGDTHAVSAKGPQPDDSEIGVSQHHRVRSAPFHVRKLLGIYKVNFGFERRIKPVFPRAELREDRRVTAVYRVPARPEHVRYLSF